MPQNNCNPAHPPVEALPAEQCPKCGVEMEPIEVGEGLPLAQLQLCPGCYLVMWTDEKGLHARQGVPIKKGTDLFEETSGAEEC